MKIYEIKQERQENGMWGTPLNCYSIDRFILLDDRKFLLFSAAIALLGQIYNPRTFKIFGSSDMGFVTEVSNIGIRSFRYDRYELVDNLLYEFENDKEHKVFLRKQKIQKIQKINATE